LVALEHSSPQSDLSPAYAATLQRWPDSLVAILAAGNDAYNHNNPARAEQLFLHATQVHPESVAAHNNLAQTLSKLGKHEAALSAALRAVELGGAMETEARATLKEIQSRAAEAQQ
jgi:tetratricopeptide (TPR) repeat protein